MLYCMITDMVKISILEADILADPINGTRTYL